MAAMIEVENLRKTYDGGFEALKGVSLSIEEGEILALLGPNGAGKTTLISTICGITEPTSGTIRVGGFDAATNPKAARRQIGIVPQEVNIDMYAKVWDSLAFTRGLWGKPRDDAHIEKVLRQLSLWDKKDGNVMSLSGGMKRRVLIGKALSHEPNVLFLDEPTAGVDVELRKGMWEVVEELRQAGTTIILTTHYLEEAEAMADRIAVITGGEIRLVERKDTLMRRMGHKTLTIELAESIGTLPPVLAEKGVVMEGPQTLSYSYDSASGNTGITRLLTAIRDEGLKLADLSTKQSSLEEIFVGLVHEDDKEKEAAE
ncbi:ABC transporter ATP-binding protein [Pseudoroseicyclus tamaricis]|uniref:ABC transporter ATP-binding protein n=1 Tax=Pseudoroseicyclus tamaricis TaxID=2705421 RepID=A0A6B2JUZ3_9RHOB|nr:ABC transporter ATP-binding protein [Pseudoroseicyclus tamaricis]NDV02327.1 ABC transporter ATP-binding protein [Pseudoroseicyclus tamaricis]